MYFNIQISIIYFIIGFAIGILYVYVTHEPPRVIWHHSGSTNDGSKIIYKDNKNKCYRYLAENIQCPSDIANTLGHNNITPTSIEHPLIIGT